MAAFSAGKSRIYGVERLRIKESDRLSGVLDFLQAAKIQATYDGNALVIHGGKPQGGVFNAANDHRMAMSEGVLAAFAEGDSVICGGEAVTKSYPRFWEDFSDLGGKCRADL